MYVRHNIEEHLINHCCSGKAISITHSDCVCSLTYPVINVHALYYIVILCPVRLHNIFPHYLIKDTIFEKNY